MDTNLQTQLTNLAITVLGGALSILSIYASIYVKKAVDLAKAKAEQIQDAQAKKIVDDTLNRTQDLITTGIEALENTTKKDIIADIQAGKVGKSALNQLSDDVQNDVLKQLGDNGIAILNTEISNVDKYISDKIESTLGQLKLSPSSPVSKTVLPEVITPIVDTTELTNANIQLQADKDSLTAQVNQITLDKNSIEQANDTLTQTVTQVQLENDSLKSQLSQVQSTLQTLVNPFSTTSGQVDTTNQTV